MAFHHAAVLLEDKAAVQDGLIVEQFVHKRAKLRNSGVKSCLPPLIEFLRMTLSRHLHLLLEQNVDLVDVRLADLLKNHPLRQCHCTLSVPIHRMEVFLMAKSRPVIDQKAIDRMLKQGRGQGIHEKYKPWLTVRDVASLGKSSRDKGWKTGRPHHFLSTLELLYYLTLEWSLMITDIREQYPLLPIDDTIAIADSLDVKHPTHPKTKELVVMTTDFCISLQNEGGSFEHARTVKYAKDLAKPRTIEKLEIERRFWEARGIDWGIVTEHEIPIALAKNVDFLHDKRDLPSNMSAEDVSPIAELLTRLVVGQDQPLCELTTLSDKQLGLKGGTSLRIAYYLLTTRQWHIDMNVPIDPDQRLVVLGTGLNTIQGEE